MLGMSFILDLLERIQPTRTRKEVEVSVWRAMTLSDPLTAKLASWGSCLWGQQVLMSQDLGLRWRGLNVHWELCE